jgi:hypothetical protein
VVSRNWLTTVISHEESSAQVEVAFTHALTTDDKDHLLDEPVLAETATGRVDPGNPYDADQNRQSGHHGESCEQFHGCPSVPKRRMTTLSPGHHYVTS